MKTSLILMFIVLGFQFCFSQTDSVKIINEEYAQYIFNKHTKTKNLSYNYSNKWDFDGDTKPDSLYFIGNGGAHSYFYLKIILSSDNLSRDFPTVQLDMPYIHTIESIKMWNKNPGIQFAVGDLNKDGRTDIYLNFNNPFGSIPKSWRNKGIKTKNVLLSFTGNMPHVTDYN